MPEKTKAEKQIEKKHDEDGKIGEESLWSKDQQEKSYYYDDDYGYEIYNADEEDEEDS